MADTYQQIFDRIQDGDFIDAIASLRNTSHFDESAPFHNLLWGVLSSNIGEYKSAKTYIEKEITLHPFQDCARHLLTQIPLPENLPWENPLMVSNLPDTSEVRPQLNLDLNNGCNINCVMCGRHQESPRTQRILPFEIFKANLLPAFSKLSNFQLGCDHEPLIVPYFEEMLELISNLSNRARGQMVTNSMAMNESKARLIMSSDIFHTVRISFDGATADTFESVRRGAKFKVVTERIERLVRFREEYGVKTLISLHVTPQPRNVSELPEIVRLAKKLGADSVTTNKLSSDINRKLDPDYYTVISLKMKEAEQAAEEVGIQFAGQIYECGDNDMSAKLGPVNLVKISSRDSAEQTKSEVVADRPRKPVCGMAPPNLTLRLISNGNIIPTCMQSNIPLGNIAITKLLDILNGNHMRWLVSLHNAPSRKTCADCWAFTEAEN